MRLEHHALTVPNPSGTLLCLLGRCKLPKTTRLTHRAQNLRRPYMQRHLMLRYKVAMVVRNFLAVTGWRAIYASTPQVTDK